MKGKYKKSYLVINIILFVLLVFLLTNFFVFKQSSYLFLLISILLPTLLIILIYGYEKKKRRYMYEEMFYVFIFSILFLITTYIFGLFTGFTKSIYSFSFSNIKYIIIPYLLLIIVSEIFRYEIVRKGDNSNLAYILMTIILVMIDITLFMSTYNLNTGDGQIKFICAIVLPSISKNIFLLYSTRNGGIIPSIIYRVIMDLKIVILPIFPSFGIFFESIINLITPAFIGLFVHLNLMKYEHKKIGIVKDQKKRKYKIIAYIMAFAIILIFNMLISGQFKYGLLAIGSESMSNYINKGDAIFYKKMDDNEKYDVGDILIFKKEDKVIVHRIMKRLDINDEVVYYTKGDANLVEDGYPITNDNIIGIFKCKLKYLGIPSIFIKELFD